MKAVKYVVLLDKKTRDEVEIPARDFLHPHSSSYQESKLKPKTFIGAFKMLMDLLEGDIHQNTEQAVKLKGIGYRWNWSE